MCIVCDQNVSKPEVSVKADNMKPKASVQHAIKAQVPMHEAKHVIKPDLLDSKAVISNESKIPIMWLPGTPSSLPSLINALSRCLTDSTEHTHAPITGHTWLSVR